MFLEIADTNELFYQRIDRRIRTFKLLTIPGNATVEFFKNEKVNSQQEEDTFSASAYGNGLFVVVSEVSNKVLIYNIEEDTFKKVEVAEGASGAALVYGKGLFVSVAGNKILTSENGLTWTTSATLADGWTSKAILFSGDKFVALPFGGKTGYYSTNGITWTSFNLEEDYEWGAVAYGAGHYTALAKGKAISMHSTDGINWSIPKAANLPMEGEWSSIVFGNNRFLAVGSVNGAAIASADGITWRKVRLTPPFENFYGNLVCHSGEYFLILDSANNRAMISVDAISFYYITVSGTNWNTLVASNNKFLVTSNSEDRVFSLSTIPSVDNTVKVLKGTELYFKASLEDYFTKIGSYVVTKHDTATVILTSKKNQLTYYCGPLVSASTYTRPFPFKTTRAKIPVSQVSGTFVTSSGTMCTYGINSLRKES